MWSAQASSRLRTVGAVGRGSQEVLVTRTLLTQVRDSPNARGSQAGPRTRRCREWSEDAECEGAAEGFLLLLWPGCPPTPRLRAEEGWRD